jgi:hypothetical protein
MAPDPRRRLHVPRKGHYVRFSNLPPSWARALRAGQGHAGEGLIGRGGVLPGGLVFRSGG